MTNRIGPAPIHPVLTAIDRLVALCPLRLQEALVRQIVLGGYPKYWPNWIAKRLLAAFPVDTRGTADVVLSAQWPTHENKVEFYDDDQARKETRRYLWVAIEPHKGKQIGGTVLYWTFTPDEEPKKDWGGHGFVSAPAGKDPLPQTWAWYVSHVPFVILQGKLRGETEPVLADPKLRQYSINKPDEILDALITFGPALLDRGHQQIWRGDYGPFAQLEEAPDKIRNELVRKFQGLPPDTYSTRDFDQPKGKGPQPAIHHPLSWFLTQLLQWAVVERVFKQAAKG